MSSQEKMVKTYAKSLFQHLLVRTYAKKTDELLTLTSEKVITTSTHISNILLIGEELLLIQTLFSNSEKLRSIFKSPLLPEQQKMSILLSFFPSMSKIVRSFLSILVEKSHLSYISEISEEFNEMLLKYRKIAKVTLYISSPLEEMLGLKFLTILKKLTESNEIILNVIYSPKILAGLILEYSSMSINASILSSFKIF